MRVTFMNQLAMASREQESVVCYRHPYRINVEIYICANEEEERGWEIMFNTQNKMKLPGVVQESLLREFRRYIQQRVKRNPSSLQFDDFVDMARAINVNG